MNNTYRIKSIENKSSKNFSFLIPVLHRIWCSGIVPYFFSPKVAVNAIQWAIGLEFNQCSAKANSKSQLGDINRELKLNDICIITRAGTAKCLGMVDRGHLGTGAIGDVAIYKLDPDKADGQAIEKAFSLAAYTIKDGQIVVKNGEITATPMGTTICAEGKVKDEIMESMLEDVKAHWRDHYSINFANYPVHKAYVPKVKIVNGTKL